MEPVTDTDAVMPTRPTLLGATTRLADSVNILEAVDAKPKKHTAVRRHWKPLAGITSALAVAAMAWTLWPLLPSGIPAGDDTPRAAPEAGTVRPVIIASETPAATPQPTEPLPPQSNPLLALNTPAPAPAPAKVAAVSPNKTAAAPAAPSAESIRATSTALKALAGTEPAPRKKESAATVAVATPAAPVKASPATPPQNPDVELVNVIMRHVSLSQDNGVSISGLVKQCMNTDDIESLMCRRKICEGHWGNSKACPVSMAPRAVRSAAAGNN